MTIFGKSIEKNIQFAYDKHVSQNFHTNKISKWQHKNRTDALIIKVYVYTYVVLNQKHINC